MKKNSEFLQLFSTQTCHIVYILALSSYFEYHYIPISSNVSKSRDCIGTDNLIATSLDAQYHVLFKILTLYLHRQLFQVINDPCLQQLKDFAQNFP